MSGPQYDYIEQLQDLGKTLPPLPARDYWSLNISRAYDILQNAYQHAAGLLRQEDCDPLRIRIHVDQITQQMLPLLEMLHREMEEIAWTTACATIFGQLLCSLEKFACSASGQ